MDTVGNGTSIGFLCNARAHWFAVRPIHYTYYHLDSVAGVRAFLSERAMFDYLQDLMIRQRGTVLQVSKKVIDDQ